MPGETQVAPASAAIADAAEVVRTAISHRQAREQAHTLEPMCRRLSLNAFIARLFPPPRTIASRRGPHESEDAGLRASRASSAASLRAARLLSRWLLARRRQVGARVDSLVDSRSRDLHELARSRRRVVRHALDQRYRRGSLPLPAGRSASRTPSRGLEWMAVGAAHGAEAHAPTCRRDLSTQRRATKTARSRASASVRLAPRGRRSTLRR